MNFSAGMLPIGVALALVACSRQAPVEWPTLCQLGEAREAYAGRTLTVEGYLLVSAHGSVVTDPRCGYGIGVTWTAGTSPQLRAFDALAGRMLALEPWIARVRVTGVMRQDEHGEFAGRAWRLRLTAAEILSQRRLAPKDEDRYMSWLEGPSPAPFQSAR